MDLGAVVAQLPKLAGLFLVVCFGSCMDVAAIQSDMPTPLDFNKELMTVGGCRAGRGWDEARRGRKRMGTTNARQGAAGCQQGDGAKPRTW